MKVLVWEEEGKFFRFKCFSGLDRFQISEGRQYLEIILNITAMNGGKIEISASKKNVIDLHHSVCIFQKIQCGHNALKKEQGKHHNR